MKNDLWLYLHLPNHTLIA